MHRSRMPPNAARARDRVEQRPVHPYLVLLTAVVFPGFGHVLCAAPQRGLILQAFMILMGWITWHATTPDHSLIGRLAGGLFIYAVSIPDAYRIAKIRYVAFATRR
jgi:hypothetical protein